MCHSHQSEILRIYTDNWFVGFRYFYLDEAFIENGYSRYILQLLVFYRSTQPTIIKEYHTLAGAVCCGLTAPENL